MTRANIELIQDCFPKRTFLEVGGDGYPENLLPAMVKFLTGHVWSWAVANNKEIIHYQQIQKGEFVDLVSELWAGPGAVGNWSYSYRIDLIKGEITVWDYKYRWFYAPENWEEKGYICNETKNGRAGYHAQVKNKKIHVIKLKDIIENGGVKIGDEWIKYKLP